MSQGSNEQDGPDEVRHAELTWVGDQRLMQGYCGRAPTKPAAESAATTNVARPVAVVRRAKPWQGRVVRIGPPRAAACNTEHAPGCAAETYAAAG